ncbi:MAG: hypothetical protein U0638_09200 [Phycisphaerales bacterium]
MNATMNIAMLIVACKRVEGRKKLQKIVHILQCCGFGRDFPHQFGYLHYGPYSHEVKADIDGLTNPAGPLVEESEATAGLGYRTFAYSPSLGLKEALEGSSESASWAPLARQLNQKSPQELEAVSTVLYLKRSGVADSAIKERFCQLKPALADRFGSTTQFVATLSGSVLNSSGASGCG